MDGTLGKRTVGWRVNTRLLDLIAERAERENRSRVSLVEQALAEYLAIPIANPELPPAPVELCRCERGVLSQTGLCSVCRWRRPGLGKRDLARN